MKRFLLLFGVAIWLTLKVYGTAAADNLGWFSNTAPYIQTTALNVTSMVHCNEPATAFAYSTITAISCNDGSILDWSKYVPNPFVPMNFGSIRSDGAIRLGGLQSSRNLRLPEGYQLYAIESTSAVLLVDDGVAANGVVDAAYYPDLMAKINLTDMSVESPLSSDKFSDGHVFLGLYPYGLSFSENRKWLIGYSTSYGYVRLDLASKQYISIGGSYSLDYGSSRVAMLASSSISNDGLTAVLADNSVNSSGGLRIYSLDTSRSSCRLVSGRYLVDCPNHSFTSYLQAKIANLRGIRSVRFVTDKILDIEVSVGRTDEQYNRYRVSLEPLSSTTESYLALGDSVASGEGAHYYRSGTDELGGNKCHNSLAAYPYLLRAEAHSVACSGARIADLNGFAWGQRSGRSKESYSSAEIDQLLRRFMPGNLNQLEFIKKYQPSAVTLSVGGNDLGFATLLSSCIDPRRSWVGNGCFSTYEDRLEILQTIENQYEPLAALYRKLLTANPTGRLYVIGYPQIVSDKGSCGLNVQLGQDERLSIIAMTNAFDAVIERAATNSGAFYVDIAEALDGHKLCEPGPTAVNGITTGDDSFYVAKKPVLGQEGFHPTAYGHTLLAKAIITKTANLTIAMPATKTPLPTYDHEVQLWRDSAPKSGRTIGQRQIIDTEFDNDVLTYTDAGRLLGQNYPAHISFDGQSSQDLRYDSGKWRSVIDGVPKPGLHFVEITGYDPFGQSITLNSVINTDLRPKASINAGALISGYEL